MKYNQIKASFAECFGLEDVDFLDPTLAQPRNGRLA